MAEHALTLFLSLVQPDRLCYQSRADRGALRSPGAAWAAGRSRVSGAWIVTVTLSRSH